METWKDVVGFEGLYAVSSEGRVMKKSGRMLKTDAHGHHGYHKAEMRRGDYIKREYVHRMVLAAFVGPCPGGMMCRHLDGNPTNNRVENLAWGTPQENVDDAVRHGTIKRTRVKRLPRMHRGPRRKLSERRFAEMMKDLAGGMNQTQAAKKYGMSQPWVNKVVKGVIAHTGEPRVTPGHSKALPYRNFRRRGGFPHV